MFKNDTVQPKKKRKERSFKITVTNNQYYDIRETGSEQKIVGWPSFNFVTMCVCWMPDAVQHPNRMKLILRSLYILWNVKDQF